MKVTVERIPESQVLLNIEIDPERVQSSMDQAYRRIAPRARVPGFRPGKAPRALVERHYGREALLQEALDKLVPSVVAEAIEAESLDIVDRPDMEITNLDPVTVKATVPVRPSVDLGEYRDLRVERHPVEVDPAQIDESIENLRRRYATVEPVDRPVEDGDVIRADVRAVANGDELANEEDAELTVREEELTSLPGLHPKLIGLKAGETRTFEVAAPEEPSEDAAEEASEETPDDASDGVAAKTITYTVTVRDVKTQTLPELDDEFAKEVGESFPTLVALRERLESDMRTRLETEADSALEEEALNQLTERAQIESPPQLVEREIERMLQDQGVPNDPRAFERLLQQAGLSEAQVRNQFRTAAGERVRRSLVLNRLREQEGLSVSAEEVEAELNRMVGDVPGSSEQIRRLFDTESGRQVIERNLLTRKTVERLRQIALGEAPPPAEPATETPPAPDAARQEPADTPAEPAAAETTSAE